LLIPCSLAIIGATFDESERGKAIGTWAGFSAIAGAAGPLLGGTIVDHFSWRWIFLINPLLALPTIWIALTHVPESRDAEAKGGLDWRGSLLAFAALGSLAYGLISAPVAGWRDATVLLSLAAGLLLMAVFIWEEAHSRNPMLPLGLFRSRTFSAVNVLTLLLYAALGGAFFFLPFALIQVAGFSAALTGAAFLPFTLILGALSRWSGGVLDRFGARWPLMVGPAVAALGFGLLALPVGGASYWAFLGPIAILGLGMVVSVAPLTTTVINAVPTHQTGVASGINKVSKIVDQKAQDFLDVMDANVTQSWLMARAAARQMLKQGKDGQGLGGKIILTSSARGLLGHPAGYTAYCASKSAVDGITKALGCELGDTGITVNALGPTVFRSPLTAWMYEDTDRARDVRKGFLARVPKGRLGEPSDLAGPLLFLASRASDFYTGHILYADGGYTAG